MFWNQYDIGPAIIVKWIWNVVVLTKVRRNPEEGWKVRQKKVLTVITLFLGVCVNSWVGGKMWYWCFVVLHTEWQLHVPQQYEPWVHECVCVCVSVCPFIQSRAFISGRCREIEFTFTAQHFTILWSIELISVTHTAPLSNTSRNRLVFRITTALRNRWIVCAKCGVSIDFAAIFTQAVVIIGLQSVYLFFSSNGSWINNPMYLGKNDVLPNESYLLLCNCFNRKFSISPSQALLCNTCQELMYCNCQCSDGVHFSYMSVAL